MRLAVYCDYPYRIEGDRLYAEQPVGLFLAGMAPHCERLVMVGRLDPSPGRFPYEMPGASLAPLPFYASAANPLSLVRAVPAAVRSFWRALGDIDLVWVFGPSPMSLLFALLTLMRGRRLALGVRQDLPRLFAHRYPHRRLLRLGARVLEETFRALSRRVPVVVVGPDLARRYRRAARAHTVYISLLSNADLDSSDSLDRRYDGPELRMLSVGRLDPEKNPLLLADVLAGALEVDPRWHLDVCGEGPLTPALAQRLTDLGVADRAVLRGHIPIDEGLLDRYRQSHALIHVSFTEGVPQVLLEALTMRLPVVATAVGGVPDLVRDCGLLVGPGDAGEAVSALSRIVSDEPLRRELVGRGTQRAREHTLEAECSKLARFLT